MKEPNIELAKRRIWKRLEAKLPDRENVHFAPVFSALRFGVQDLPLSQLKKVQAKEHLLDLLPERELTPAKAFFPSRLLSLGTLSLMLGVLFVPLMDLMPSVAASSQNVLELVEGQVYVNGVQVKGTTLLQVGDSVETGEGSLAHLTFVDDSRLTLGPSSKVDIVDAWIDPADRSKSHVELLQEEGRSWSQVLNLTDEASFAVHFPQGKVWVNQRASFDLQVSEEAATVEVARNLVELEVKAADGVYSGFLGQGAELSVSSSIETQEISEEDQKDVWWTFNLAYGKAYARTLDENYKRENISHASILPGNPFYFLKTFRESLQVSFAFTEGAKQDVLLQQAETRLNEAQALLAQGETESAAAVMKVYEETVEAVEATSPSEALLVLEDEVQKEALTDHVDMKTNTMLQAHLDANASLQLVPDLIAEGQFDEAVAVLEAYNQSSLSLVADLQDLNMEDREAAVSQLLDQKLADVQLLKVIATMPELSESVDMNASVLKELSVMALSLREKEMDSFDAYFEATKDELSVQEDLYEHIKNDASIPSQLEEQFNEIEEQMEAPVDTVVIDIRAVEETLVEPQILDPRFSSSPSSVPHSDEPQK
ncbi:FecR domain-containing protein [Candidatus Peregrinibacteria bacterium]|nr:MAG: FecR domain-containing protein [Candidatus Peregrinibacteria bacterium]